MELKDIYIFEWLKKEELLYFSLMTQNVEFKKWNTILKEWEKSNEMAYIIESWEVDIFIKWEKISSLWDWEIFWEIALITNDLRTATVKATRPTKIMTLYKDDFLMLYEKSWNNVDIKQKILKRIKNNFYWIKK